MMQTARRQHNLNKVTDGSDQMTSSGESCDKREAAHSGTVGESCSRSSSMFTALKLMKLSVVSGPKLEGNVDVGRHGRVTWSR